MVKRTYTTAEVAKICKVSPATIFRAITGKTLKAFTTPGGHFRIAQDDLELFLKANNVPCDNLPSDRKRILIVEDNPVELRMFKRALSFIPSFDTEVTNSGYYAGFLTRSFQPNLILLDINLPDVDGLEVTRLIRTEPCLKGTKIIGMSGSKRLKEEAAKAMGFDGFVHKPISPSELRKKIKEMLD